MKHPVLSDPFRDWDMGPLPRDLARVLLGEFLPILLFWVHRPVDMVPLLLPVPPYQAHALHTGTEAA